MTTSPDDRVVAPPSSPADGDGPETPGPPPHAGRGPRSWSDRRFPWSIDAMFRGLALAVIGMLLIGLVGSDRPDAHFLPSTDTAAMWERIFAHALDPFRQRTGALPARLDELVAEDPITKEPYLDHVPDDPWGTPYRYVVHDARRGRFEVRSAGRDRAFDTDDDVVLER